MSDNDAEANPRVRGKVKWYNSVRGYGFLVSDLDGEDSFFHISSIVPDYEFDPEEGDSVSYEIVPGKDGRVRAAEIVILTKDAPATEHPADAKEALETELGK